MHNISKNEKKIDKDCILQSLSIFQSIVHICYIHYDVGVKSQFLMSKSLEVAT